MKRTLPAVGMVLAFSAPAYAGVNAQLVNASDNIGQVGTTLNTFSAALAVMCATVIAAVMLMKIVRKVLDHMEAAADLYNMEPEHYRAKWGRDPY